MSRSGELILRIEELDNREYAVQGSEDWHKARYNAITASDCASALGESGRFQSQRQLLIKKCKGIEHRSDGNHATNHGHKFEPVALAEYQKRNDNIHVGEYGLVIHDEYPWLGASPDGITADGIAIEIKCPKSRAITNTVPWYYRIQVQIQLEVLDLEECHFIQCKAQDLDENMDENTDVDTDEKSPEIIITQYGILEQYEDHTEFNAFDESNNDPVKYKLMEYSQVTIKRDREWFKESLPKLKEFWDKVLYYREHGSNILIQNEKRLTPGGRLRKRKRKPVNSTIKDVSNLIEEIAQTDGAPELYQNWNEWVAASQTRNFVLKDTILDWLEWHGKNKGLFMGRKFKLGTIPQFKTRGLDFGSFLMRKGTEFEDAVMASLHKKFKGKIKEIANASQVRSVDKVLETLNEMRKGTPILVQGVLHNAENKTYGMPDLIVRSDYVNKLVKTAVLTKKQYTIQADNLNVSTSSLPRRSGRKRRRITPSANKYHYVIVDIKLTTLKLRSDGIHLLTAGSIPAYKAQLCIYNEALGQLQGYTPSCAYVLGRKYNYTKTIDKVKHVYAEDNCFAKLGTIDYQGIDEEYVEQTAKAVEWIKDMRANGADWDINPPSRPELYPNMCNAMDSPWHKVKKDIAESIDEITNLWQCGVKRRDIAHENGIFKWTDTNLTAGIMGFKEGKSNTIKLDKMLEVNRSDDIMVYPDIIQNNNQNWQDTNKIELYVDFEAVNDLTKDFSDLSKPGASMIFMIGVGWESPVSGSWKYKDFTMNRLTKAEERKCIRKFYKYVRKIENKFNRKALLFHWGQFEQTTFKAAQNRHNKLWNVEWFDFLRVMRDEPIIIKGALNFSLKTITKAMYKNEMIEANYEDSACADGLQAMVQAYECHKEAIRKDVSMIDLPKMQEIIKYNEIDCKTLYEIVNYLRDNHGMYEYEYQDVDVEDDLQPKRKKQRTSYIESLEEQNGHIAT